MPDILGAANPVPGYDKSLTNRSIPVTSENNVQLQNVPDPSRVVRADGRTEQHEGGGPNGGYVRYDSNFQNFIQQLRNTPGLAQTLAELFAGREGTVVLSGMQEGIATEMAQILDMLRMDEGQLLNFLTGQASLGTRFGGELFSLLRTAYAGSSDTVKFNILQFLKSYSDNSSSVHIENSIMRDLERMADAMPTRWADPLREMIGQLKNSFAAGDRAGSIQLMQRQIISHMASYVDQTHDMGLPREMLTMLTLNLARYENGSPEKMLDLFHQLRSFGTLKNQLGGIDDQTLMRMLEKAGTHEHRADSAISTPASAAAAGETAEAAVKTGSAAQEFSDRLISAASRALQGEGSQEVQQGFRNLVSALLIHESVYMPINHYLIPLQWDDRLMFSEMWVDPDAEEDGQSGTPGGRAIRFLLKLDVQPLGMFDVVLTSRQRNVDVMIACPESVSSFSKQIERAVGEILTRNDLTPTRVQVRRMERPAALTDVFPKIFAGKGGVDVKV